MKEFKVGRGTEDGVASARSSTRSAVDKADELVQDAVARGANVLTGGSAIDGAGTFYAADRVSGVEAGKRHPARGDLRTGAGIVTFTDEAEAVRIANDTEYGLIGYVFTQDLARGQRLIDRCRPG